LADLKPEVVAYLDLVDIKMVTLRDYLAEKREDVDRYDFQDFAPLILRRLKILANGLDDLVDQVR
jgi:hypothetical protein